jgi:hypothetical protein
LRFDRAELYAGGDISAAFARSDVVPSSASPLHAAHFGIGAQRLIDDALSSPTLRMLPAATRVTGTEASSGAPMTILFQGQLKAVDFCARHILGTDQFETQPLRGVVDTDVVVTDHPLLDRDLFASRPCIAVQPWIGQRCDLADTWERTLDQRPPSLRKELGRVLRKHAFTVAIIEDPSAKRVFYDRLYTPYIARRFGREGIVRSERAFLRESEHAVLLALHLEGQMSGATLLSRRGDVLAMGKSALNVEHDAADRSELLDYFCLLLAQKLGFGVSRPHVDDGVFRYKCKWRPRLVPSGGLKSVLRIRPVVRSEATLAFLRRNGFIERRRGRFFLRQLRTDAGTLQERVELGQLAARSGLDRLIVAFANGEPAHASSTELPSNVESLNLGDSSDPLRAFLERA